MFKPLIVIPLFNHAATVRKVVQDVLGVLRELDAKTAKPSGTLIESASEAMEQTVAQSATPAPTTPADLLIVDDGSTDNGADALAGLPLHLVRHERNRGKGAAILTAAQWAQNQGFTHLLTIDADGQHDARDLPALLAAGRERPFAIVIGARDFNTPNVPGASRFGRDFSAFWARVQTGQRVGDIQSGLRLYPLAVFAHLRLSESRYSLEMEVVIKALWAGFEVREIPVRVYYPAREERVSHFKKWRDNARIAWLNTRLTFRALLPLPHRQFAQFSPAGKASGWSSRSLASAFAHRVFYFFIRCGGRRLAYFFLYFVVPYYTALPGVRERSSHYLRRRFGDCGPLQSLRHAWKLNHTFAQVLVDRAVLGITGKADYEPISEAERTLYLQLLGRGNGLILLTAHAGCWQMAMSCFEFANVENYVVYHRTRADVDKLAHEHGGGLRGPARVHFIDPAGPFGGAVEIMAALQRNSLVCLMGDRLFGSQEAAVRVPFLGGEIALPASIYRIAAAMRTPVLVMFFPRVGAGKFRLMQADLFDVPDRGAGSGNYREEARRFAAAMENFCEKYGHQFFNYYNLWQ